MRKGLFLEYKFGDYDLEILRQSGGNELIVCLGNLTPKRWQELQAPGMSLSLTFGAFDCGDCPFSPRARKKLHKRIKEALIFNPTEIWLDGFRFAGHWEAKDGNHISGLHRECRWCRNKERVRILADIAREIREIVPRNTGLGYFAVPFKIREVPELVSSLGQDHRLLGRIFDIISPMLYHRMIKKTVGYISEYVDYLHHLTKKPVLPIIQVKDMPDDLPDRLGQEEMSQAFRSAIKPPSVGVAWFSWDGAIEKEKTQIIKEIFQVTH